MKKYKAVITRLNTPLKGLASALSFSVFLLMIYSLKPAILRAEVPVKFNYQGNLRQAGFLVNGNRNMTFRIYDSSSNGAELCPSLVKNNVDVSTGVFRVSLEPAIADWQTGSMWLEIEVDGNRMTPREELTSSPYSINSLMISGKRYTSAAGAPAAPVPGDLWYDTVSKSLNYWNGAAWVDTSVAGLPVAHAATHSGAGIDPIVSLGTHAVTGYITVSSAVTAAWLNGEGSGIYSLDASKISFGYINGDRIGDVIVSTHIVDGSIQTADLADGLVTKAKINASGCVNGNVLQMIGGAWDCGASSGAEADPLSIHNQQTPQAGTTFYVSSGTVNDLNVNNSLKVTGTISLKGLDTENYSLAIGTGTASQVVVSTSGSVGIGTGTPAAKLDVTGSESSGQYIAVFNSGSKTAAWLRNK